MSDHWSDDERVAAFLDGRMDSREREEMVARLSRNGEDRDVLAGTAFILRQLEEAEAEATVAAEADAEEEAAAVELGQEPVLLEGVISLGSRRRTAEAEPVRNGRRRVPLAGWMALAAVLTALAVVTGRELQGRGSIAGEPVRLAGKLPAEFPEDWLNQRPWGPRGAGTSDSVSVAQRSAQASQAGMMLVDLAVAVEARDSAKTRLLATQIGERFDSLAWDRGALGAIAGNAGASPRGLRPRIRDATERLAERMDSAALRLGAWTEAAGLAAASRDAGFFRDRATRRVLEGAHRVTAADSEADKSLREVRRLVGTDPPSWELLIPALDRLARRLATE